MKKRAESLQFLRFLAFILIYLFHANAWYTGGFGAKGALCAVSFFFMLSGVCTGYSAYEKNIFFSISACIKHVTYKIILCIL